MTPPASRQRGSGYSIIVALIVALGGFLMGFDASVISGVVGFIEEEFSLSKIELGWAVSSLALTATLGMLGAGPLSDRLGRRPVLRIAAVLFAVSALASAIAPSFPVLVAARMIGGLGVGAALIVAPMYIAEIAPPESRGRLVSVNQLNIVIGISAAFFSNYLILHLGSTGASWSSALQLEAWNWRWMLGVEMLPAVIYLVALSFVPESPRWLALAGRDENALAVLERAHGPARAGAELAAIKTSLASEARTGPAPLKALLDPALRLPLAIGISVGILQQITGINSVFFYAPMIFEASGIGTNAAFLQAVLVGLVNLVFTILAMTLIDRLGRRPLLGFGLAGIGVCMLVLAHGFGTATYSLSQEAIDHVPAGLDRAQLSTVAGAVFDSDREFRDAIYGVVGAEAYQQYEAELVNAAITVNPWLILAAILGFVASFAVSIGPVMWVLFSELFPNRVRALAISFVGVINSSVAFLVTLLFPWQLETLGNAATFLIYGLFAIAGLLVVMRILPETKGRSLEDLETVLTRE